MKHPSSDRPAGTDHRRIRPTVRVAEMLLAGAQAAYRWWARLSLHQATVDRLRWSYLDGGGGDPVLLVHGFGADKYRFGPMVPSLTRYFRVVVPDLPGFGESTRRVSLPYDIESQTERLAHFIDAVGLRRFHLFGVSMGGYIAALYAADHPQRLLSLALIDAAGVRSPRPSTLLRRFSEDGTILLLYRSRQEFDRLLSALFYRPPWIPGAVKNVVVQQALRDFEVRRKILSDLVEGGTDLLDARLPDIHAPTLVMWGSDDRIVDRSCVDVFLRGIRRSRAVVFDRCGHIPIIEKWRRSGRIYRDFLAGLHPSRKAGRGTATAAPVADRSAPHRIRA